MTYTDWDNVEVENSLFFHPDNKIRLIRDKYARFYGFSGSISSEIDQEG